MHVARRIDADQTVAVLDRLATLRGAPTHVRCDNGAELTEHALRDWCRYARTETAFIEPGSPWQNAYVESFNGRARDERLDVEQFACLTEARVLIEDWRQDYNAHRPHSALANLTPHAFAQTYRVRTADLA
jgi:putative transposase